MREVSVGEGEVVRSVSDDDDDDGGDGGDDDWCYTCI